MIKERNISQLEKMTLFGIILDGGYILYSFYTQKPNHILFSIFIFLGLLTVHIIVMVLKDREYEQNTVL